LTPYRYETRPINPDLWNRMKDLRRERAKLSFKAQSQGGLCVTGFAWGFLSLLAGFGNFGNPSPGASFTKLAREGTGDEGLSKYVDIAESRGLTPVCGAIGAHLGQVYASLDDENRIKPDFVFQPGGCHALMKGAQATADAFGIPMLPIDLPDRATASTRKYLLSQLAEAIDWIEKKTGRKFDDGKFVNATVNAIKSMVYWSKTCELMKNIPAPMTYRQAMSLRLPLVTYAYSKQAAEYMEALYAEISGRVRDGIAGSPIEEKRLVHQGVHPLYRPDVLTWPEEYGAVFVQGGLFSAFGAWRYTKDGHTVAGQTPEERGIALKTREDALQALVDAYLPIEGESGDFSEKRRICYLIQLCKDWHVDGVMLHLARRCAVLTGGVGHIRESLRSGGIAFGTYEASESDPKEFSEARVREEFAGFLEGMGLSKLPPGSAGVSPATD
jgi:benzoyl-CoA reductase subunit B